MSDNGEMRTYYYNGSFVGNDNAFIQAAVEAGHHNLDMDEQNNYSYCELEKMYDGAEAVVSLSEPQIRVNTPPPPTPQMPVITNPAPEANVYPISPGMKGTLRRVTTTITYDSPVKVLNGYATPELISPSKFLSKLHCDEEMPRTEEEEEAPTPRSTPPIQELKLPNVVRECARAIIRYLTKVNGWVPERTLNTVVDAHVKQVFGEFTDKNRLANYNRNCRPQQSTVTILEALGLMQTRKTDERRKTSRDKTYIVTTTEYRLITTTGNMHTFKNLM